MTATVTRLSELRLAPVPEVVEGLELLLEKARSGEVRGFAIGTACDAGCDGSMFVIGDSNISTIYLAIERVKLNLLRLGEDE